ncbi:hypothetical protein QQX98_003464 [Neonectria punicea]|uniref:Xylanolytic transcriptional activator regulatory domain-containing protein n=1 Tax=Neonectria punicea TaxID=979145 RepID=A0ABR1HEQ3_9HYPO
MADIDNKIDLMLSRALLGECLMSDPPSINEYRQVCLLAFYESHQFPGRTSWMRIGSLVSMAYWIGLDRLDNVHQHGPNRAVMIEGDLEAWRIIWWFIFRLDSYANLSASTPFSIDETVIETALPRENASGGGGRTSQGQMLPAGIDALSELITSVMPDQRRAMLPNLHLITIMALRQIGRPIQAQMLKQIQEQPASLASLERQLSSLRLAFPIKYFNPLRGAAHDETSSEHHDRLITIFHFLMSRLLVAILRCSRQHSVEEWWLN